MYQSNAAVFYRILPLSLVLLLTSCAAGNEQFTTSDPAGFLIGLWHGVIAFVALIIHIFDQSVLVYEPTNSGGWYDLGFLLGVIFVYGCGSRYCCKSPEKKKREEEWEEIGSKVELKIMRKLKEWAEDDSDIAGKDDWEEIGDKFEKKLKSKIREWAEKE